MRAKGVFELSKRHYKKPRDDIRQSLRGGGCSGVNNCSRAILEPVREDSEPCLRDAYRWDQETRRLEELKVASNDGNRTQ
jgi:hypothetical protein